MQKRGFRLNLPKKQSFIAPASLFRRIIAYVIDFIIIRFTILIPFNALLRKIIPVQEQGYKAVIGYLQNNPSINSLLVVISIAMSIMIVLYFTIFEYKTQQTPGKMIMKQWIVPEKEKITAINYLVSNLTFILVFPFMILWIIDLIHAIYSPKNQRFMEKISGILVLQKYEGI
ncbi:RDD family protein [Candidatus Woesearchaeota archaeon]|nr:RDD family protein [Candidatus Woesearchaeota archaeon]